jgi:hypothetical protein
MYGTTAGAGGRETHRGGDRIHEYRTWPELGGRALGAHSLLCLSMTSTAQSHETPTASVASSTITGWPLTWADGFSAPTGPLHLPRRLPRSSPDTRVRRNHRAGPDTRRRVRAGPGHRWRACNQPCQEEQLVRRARRAPRLWSSNTRHCPEDDRRAGHIRGLPRRAGVLLTVS